MWGKAKLPDFHTWPVRKGCDNVWDLMLSGSFGHDTIAGFAMEHPTLTVKVKEGNKQIWELPEKHQALCSPEDTSLPPLTNSTRHYVKNVCSYGHLTLIYFFFMSREGVPQQMGTCIDSHLKTFPKNSISLYLLKVYALNNLPSLIGLSLFSLYAIYFNFLLRYDW